MNTWTLEGELIYFGDIVRGGEHQGGRIKIKTAFQRKGEFTSQITEVSCVILPRDWEELKSKLIPYSRINVSGHFETWIKTRITGNMKDKTKTMHVVDNVIILK